MIRAYLVLQSKEINKGHRLAELVLMARFTKRFPVSLKQDVDADLQEAQLLWRNLHRYCSPTKLLEYANRAQVYLEVGGARVKAATLGERAVAEMAGRLYELAANKVRIGESPWNLAK
jgi:hypothetical protein